MGLSNGILNCTQNPVLPADEYYASGILTLIQTYENIIPLPGLPRFTSEVSIVHVLQVC